MYVLLQVKVTPQQKLKPHHPHLSLEILAQGGEAVDMKSFVEASVARTGSAAFSRMVAKYASIVDKHFGVSGTRRRIHSRGLHSKLLVYDMFLVPGVYFRFGVYRRAKRFSLWETYRFPCNGLAHGVPNLGGLFGNGSAVTSFQ